MKKHEIRNSKGEIVLLNDIEQEFANRLQKKFDDELKNALGFEINITTLTTIIKRVVEQKFYTVKPSSYLPVRVGEGAWSTNLLTYVTTALGGDFETGIINAGGNDTRLAQTDVGVEGISVPVQTWAKENTWSLAEINFAQMSGNWDIITAKEKARKTNWDLGIQKIAFLGTSNGTLTGLLNLPTITANTTVIQQSIKSMSESQFNTFLQNLIPVYRVNTNYTAMPNRFYIPEADYTGLGAAVSENFGLKSRLTRMKEAFAEVTMNPDFQILPLVYSDQNNNSLAKNRYVLMSYDDESVRMDIPVDYTTTLQNSINGFQFHNVGYGQFTGVQAYRPRTVVYFDFAGSIT